LSQWCREGAVIKGAVVEQRWQKEKERRVQESGSKQACKEELKLRTRMEWQAARAGTGLQSGIHSRIVLSRAGLVRKVAKEGVRLEPKADVLIGGPAVREGADCPRTGCGSPWDGRETGSPEEPGWLIERDVVPRKTK
jgi:hypothetical protein